MTTRREFHAGAAAAAAALWASSCAADDNPTAAEAAPSLPISEPPTSPPASTVTSAEAASGRAAGDVPPSWTGSEVIAMLMYPQMTALDFVGPQYFFGSLMGATVHHVAADMSPVTSDTGLSLSPTITMDDCPAEVDVLFVPGGTQGTLSALRDEPTLEFLASRGATAAHVTSVCTGSLLLGAAGLLDGYLATSHWITRDLLSMFGATPVAERYVQDRSRFTAAGVSAGLDFGLALTQVMRDTEYAKSVQLICEYDPKPALQSGSPATASPATVEFVTSMFEQFRSEVAAELQ